MKRRIMDICETAVFIAVICVSAQLAIPMPFGVPITLQTLAIPLCGYCLEAKKSLFAMLIYLFMGIIGMPVFSGFSAGASAIFNKTGGFLIGFVFLAAVCGFASKIRKFIPKLLLGAAGTLLCHLTGIIFFSHITKMNFFLSAATVSLPFLIKDLACVSVAAFISEKIKHKKIHPKG